MARHTTAEPPSTSSGPKAASNPSPRQVMASKPSTAQRVGAASDARCSQFGNTNDGTHAPPIITNSNVTIEQQGDAQIITTHNTNGTANPAQPH